MASCAAYSPTPTHSTAVSTPLTPDTDDAARAAAYAVMEMNCGSTTRRVTTRVSVIAMAAHVNSSDWNEAKTSPTAEVSFCSATSINPEMPSSTNAATIDRRTLRKAFHSPV
mgnify:FL=1